MARPKTVVRAPTTASLPNHLRIPSTTPSLVKTFAKLSRPALIELALEWLDDRNVSAFPPYLDNDQEESSSDDDETSPYPAAETIQEARNVYQDLGDRKGAKREVIDRILEGDWRHGITLRQLAMVDMRHMDEHPSRLRWTALELTRIDQDAEDKELTDDYSGCLPRIHATTFVKALQREVSSLVKAHYHLSRSTTLPLLFLRVFVTDSPYQYPRQSPESFTDSSRVVYFAFPDSSPFVYTSMAPSTGAAPKTAVLTDGRSLRRIVGDAVPKALSRPHERYALKATALTAKNLSALLALRGAGRSDSANGAFSIFADAVVEGSPLDPRRSSTVSPEEYHNAQRKVASDGDTRESGGEQPDMRKTTKPNARHAAPNPSSDPASKKRRLAAVHSRFGTTGSLSSAPLDRLDIRMLDPPVTATNTTDNDAGTDADADADADTNEPNAPSNPALTLTFTGNDVVAGIRKLAELGIVDPERMPSWMTGEEGVSVAAVRRGKRVS